jgi:predicted dithiol-disulfide oxidoreductase (DUF899 family)
MSTVPCNSSIAGTVDGLLPHLQARDVTFAFVSQRRAAADRRAERPPVRHRRSRLPHREPGFSAFVNDGGSVYHTYSTTWRGLEFVVGYYPIASHTHKQEQLGQVAFVASDHEPPS